MLGHIHASMVTAEDQCSGDEIAVDLMASLSLASCFRLGAIALILNLVDRLKVFVASHTTKHFFATEWTEAKFLHWLSIAKLGDSFAHVRHECKGKCDRHALRLTWMWIIESQTI
jgi:hypothetical protein